MNEDVLFFNTLRREEHISSYLEGCTSLFNKTKNSPFIGTLIFSNHSNDLEPWVLAQELLSNFKTKHPFIAVNPTLNHPYYVAKKIVALSRLYDRRVFINFIIGTSLSELTAVGESLSHDSRYRRLEEFIKIVQGLLVTKKPMTFKGHFYEINNLKLSSVIDNVMLMPEFYIAGSSETCSNVRANTGCSNLKMIKPIDKWVKQENVGIYLGIIARANYEEAVSVLKEKFSAIYEEADFILDISMKNTDAKWKKELMQEGIDKHFRMEPFKNVVADCPYLVGSYAEVATYLKAYINKGVHTFIIDTDLDDFNNTSRVIDLVYQKQNIH